MAFYDNFDRPDNTTSPGANYLDIGTGTGEVASKLYRAFGNGVYGCSVVNTPNYNGLRDQFAQCTLVNAAGEGGPVVRAQTGSFSCYNLLGRSDLLRIYRIDNGTFNVILDLSSTAADNDVLKLVAAGSVLLAYKNGTLMGSVTDTTYTTGLFGILGVGNPSHGNGWPCRDFWGGAGPGGSTRIGNSLMSRSESWT